MTTLGESKLKWDWTKAEGRGCMLREMTLWPVVCWVNSSSQLGHLSGWRGQDSTDSTTHSWRALKHAAQTSICCCRRCSVPQNTQKCTEQELVCVCVAFPPPTVQPQVIHSFGNHFKYQGFLYRSRLFTPIFQRNKSNRFICSWKKTLFIIIQ